MHRFSLADLHAAPWKNGGGVTREIVSIPRGAGLESFRWRASIADVSSDGPFSVFEGVDRVLVLLEGNGVELCDAKGELAHRLDTRFEPFAFSGDRDITSSLIRGPCVDFNVMTRRGFARAAVWTSRGKDALVASQAGVLFAARGHWIVRTTTRGGHELATNEGCWWDEDSMSCMLVPDSPDAVLVIADIGSNLG